MYEFFSDFPNSKTFDINLMITLLRNLTNLPHPKLGFDCLPSTNETIPGADLARFKYYRNYLAHLDDTKVISSDFFSAWEDLSEVSYISVTCLQKST